MFTFSNYGKKWREFIKNDRNYIQKYIEKPALYSLIGDVKNKKVLCAGCGTGEECEYMNQKGVQFICGFDISEDMIKVAQKSYPYISFEVMDMMNINFKEQIFDLVFSSLAVDYVEDFSRLLQQVSAGLAEGGEFIFSCFHPVKWGGEAIRKNGTNTFLLGYSKEGLNSGLCYGNYLKRREIEDIIFDELKIKYYYKPFSYTLQCILESDFEVKTFLEPVPIPEFKKKNPVFFDIHSKIPVFMVFKLVKKKK